MKTIKYISSLAAIVALFATSPSDAQIAESGTISGRVLNARTGEYLAGARVTVEGTSVVTFTDAAGSYLLANLLPGEARVTVFYTGLPSRTAQIPVTAGKHSREDITLGESAATPGSGGVVLDAFKVEASREMAAAALAINEQRFSPNIKNIASSRSTAMWRKAMWRNS